MMLMSTNLIQSMFSLVQHSERTIKLTPGSTMLLRFLIRCCCSASKSSSAWRLCRDCAGPRDHRGRANGAAIGSDEVCAV